MNDKNKLLQLAIKLLDIYKPFVFPLPDLLFSAVLNAFFHKVLHTFLWTLQHSKFVETFQLNWPCFSLYLHCCKASVIRNTAFNYICKSLHVCPRLNRGTRSARSFYFKNIYFLMCSVGCVRNRPNSGTEKSPISYEIKK